METALTLAGAALGLLVPTLFGVAIQAGIRRAPLSSDRAHALSRFTWIGVGVWTAIVWGLALTGMLAYQPGDPLPRVLLPLAAPIALALPLLFVGDVRLVLDHIPLRVLVGVQTFRLAGGAFFANVALGILPVSFWIGGAGDLLTGTLALASAVLLARGNPGGRRVFWAFTAAGLFDLVNVAVLLLVFWPSWYGGPITSAPLATFSLVMIPAIAAPMALLLHGMAVWRAIRAPAGRPVLAPA